MAGEHLYHRRLCLGVIDKLVKMGLGDRRALKTDSYDPFVAARHEGKQGIRGRPLRKRSLVTQRHGRHPLSYHAFDLLTYIDMDMLVPRDVRKIKEPDEF